MCCSRGSRFMNDLVLGSRRMETSSSLRRRGVNILASWTSQSLYLHRWQFLGSGLSGTGRRALPWSPGRSSSAWTLGVPDSELRRRSVSSGGGANERMRNRSLEYADHDGRHDSHERACIHLRRISCHHLCILGGAPCVFLDAHSHKMASLQRTLEYDTQKQFSAMPVKRDIDEIAAISEKYIGEGSPLREKIKGVVAKRCT